MNAPRSCDLRTCDPVNWEYSTWAPSEQNRVAVCHPTAVAPHRGAEDFGRGFSSPEPNSVDGPQPVGELLPQLVARYAIRWGSLNPAAARGWM